MAKRGRKGSGKALVTKSKLFRVEGMEETLAEITKTMNRVTAERLKKVFVEAAKPIWSEVKRNIAGLDVSPVMKEMLDSMMMINQGKPKRANVLEGMSQNWGRKQRPGLFSRFGTWSVVNPYWIEFGTRAHDAGWAKPAGGIKPHPFFRPAVTAKRGEVKDVLVRELKRVIEDIGK